MICSSLDINCFVQSLPLSLLRVICRKKVCLLLWNSLDMHPSVKRLHPILSRLSTMRRIVADISPIAANFLVPLIRMYFGIQYASSGSVFSSWCSHSSRFSVCSFSSLVAAEMTPEQLENRREQDREQHCQARAAEGVQITNEVNGRGETFSVDMIGRPTANQLEDFELDEDKALLLFYENSHDHVADLIQELDDCEIGEGWRWQPLSKRCVCHGGPLACSTRPQWH